MAKDFDYFGDLFKSFGDLFRNPVLILPFFIVLLITTSGSAASEFLLQDLLMGMLSNTTIALLIAGGIVAMLVSWYAYASGIYGAKLLVKGKKVFPGNMFGGGTKIYWRYVGMVLLQGIFYLVPLAIVAAIFLLAFQPAITGGDANIGFLLLGILLLLVYALYALFLYISFYFSNVFISLKGSNPWKALRNSFYFLKENPGHVLIVFLVILLLGIAIAAITFILSLLFIPLMLLAPEASSVIEIINTFIIGLIGMITQPVALIYLFKAFKDKKPKILQEK